MVRIRLPLVTGVGGFQAAAPSFQEVPGSYQGIAAGKVDAHGVLAGVPIGDPALANATVLVDVPDEDVTNGQLDNAKIKARYPDHWMVRAGRFG